MFKPLLAVATVATLYSAPANAAIYASGTVDSDGYAGTMFSGVASGYYRFTSDAPIAEYFDFSVQLHGREYSYSDDYSQWMGTDHLFFLPWEGVDIAAPVFTLRSDGFSWLINVPNDTQTHSDSCLFWPPCGYTTFNEYRVDFWSVLKMTPNDAGKSWQIEYFALPPPSAVPEPRTWAMLIAGFGVAGAGLRRSRAQRRAQPALQPVS